MTEPPAPIGSIDELFAVLAASVAHADEEDVDLLAHALQCAQRLRARAPDDIELQVAGLVHDIGTALVPNVPDAHARIGADAVRALLGGRVARLVAGHAEAKRFLVATDATYRDALSARSVVTLAAQGGPLDTRAARAFARGRDAAALVELRHADDDAKVPGAEAGTLEAWWPVVTGIAASH